MGPGRPRRALRPAFRRLAPRPRQPPRQHPDQRLPGDEIAVRGDDLRRRRRRPRLARADALGADRGALPTPRQEGARGALDRDQGPPRRLDQRDPLPIGRERRPTTPRSSGRSRSSCCGPTARRARSACSASGSPLSRANPRRSSPRPPGRTSRNFGSPSPADARDGWGAKVGHTPTKAPQHDGASGWPSRRRRRGSRARPWSLRSGRTRDRRRRGRGRSPER